MTELSDAEFINETGATEMTARCEGKSLDDIADYFETLASDQIGSQRWQHTQKAKEECRIKADVWRDAAAILRITDIKP